MNRHFWTQMTGPAFGLSFETAAPAGGSTTPTPAPAAPSPSAAAPAPTKSGFFAGLQRAKIATEAPAGETAAEKVQVLSDDKKTVLFEGSAADAEAFVNSGGTPPPPAAAAPTAPPAAAAVAAGSLPRPFVGRADITTIEAAEDLYRKSGAEAIRLNERSKALEASLQSAKVDADAKMAALTKELEIARQTPAFVELDEKSLNELWKENPAKAAQYMEQRKERAEGLRSAKERAEREVRERAEKVRAGARQAATNYEAMKKDPKTYPMFSELTDRIDAIYDKMPADRKSQYDSDPEGPRSLYTLAMGEMFIELKSKGLEVKEDAAAAARAKAASDAAALQPAGGGAATRPAPDNRTANQKSDDEWRAARAAARGQNPGSRVFRTRT